MSRSGKELAAYETLKQKLAILDKEIALRAKSVGPAQAMQLGMFQAAIKKINKQCIDQLAPPAELWKHAKEHVQGFIERQKKGEGDNLESMIDLFADPIKTPSPSSVYDLPSPSDDGIEVDELEVDISEAKEHGAGGRRASQMMMFQNMEPHIGDERVVNLPPSKDIMLFLNDQSGEAELSVEMVDSLQNASADNTKWILLIVRHMIESDNNLITTFLSVAKDEKRKEAVIKLQTNLVGIDSILKSDASIAEKAGALKMIKTHFDVATQEASHDKKDLTKRTWYGETFQSKKISIVSIFSQWEKQKDRLNQINSILDAKLGVGSPKPHTPISASSGNK
jgi:hypothetical protein